VCNKSVSIEELKKSTARVEAKNAELRKKLGVKPGYIITDEAFNKVLFSGTNLKK